jgi:hypothetical protein
MKTQRRSLVSRFVVGALFALTLTVGGVALATPSSNYYVWQVWGYVDQYRETNTGDVVVWFENSAGTRITNYPDANGVNQCPANDGLVISQTHPLFDRLSKAILAGGLARRNMKIAYEGVGGTCYIKQILVEM